MPVSGAVQNADERVEHRDGVTVLLVPEALEVLQVQVAVGVEEEAVRHAHVQHGVQEHSHVGGSLSVRDQHLDGVCVPLPERLYLGARIRLLHEVSAVAAVSTSYQHERLSRLKKKKKKQSGEMFNRSRCADLFPTTFNFQKSDTVRRSAVVSRKTDRTKIGHHAEFHKRDERMVQFTLLSTECM